MRTKLLGVVAVAIAVAIQPAAAQNRGSVDAGIFGQFKKFDKNLNIDNTVSVGGRAALYLFKNLGVEGDVSLGKADWTDGSTVKSLTLTPFAARLVYGLPMGDKWKFLVGAGWQENVYKNRFKSLNGFTAGNEYEDAITGLVGLKYCMNDKWNLRFDVPVIDHDPSPNFTGTPSLDGKATSYSFRAGIGTMLRGECGGTPYDWSMAVNPASSSLRPGGKSSAVSSATDNKGKTVPAAKLKGLRWASDNAGVATVDQSGNIVAVAPGNARVTVCATSGKIEKCATHNVTVRELTWNLTVTPPSGQADVGRSLSYSAAATDEDRNAVTGNVSWTSSNSAVATVSNGSVSCVSGGNATITATMSNPNSKMLSGSKSANATATCIAPPPPPPQPILVVQLTDVHFAFNQSMFSKAGRDTLNWVIKQLTTAPGSNWMISVEGHTDPYGSDAYNEKLSDKRATAVLNYLTKRPGKVTASSVSAASFGERCLRLVDDHEKPQQSKAAHGVNRRVEIWNLNGTQVPTDCRPEAQYRGR